MIVLDTNVVSEVFRPGAEPAVMAWMAAQRRNDLFVASATMAEIRYGVLRLAEGRKKSELTARYERVRAAFRSNILVFDLRAAEACAEIIVAREQAGAPILPLDAHIAGIARSRGASVATRDVSGFAGCGVPVIDPWRHRG